MKGEEPVFSLLGTTAALFEPPGAVLSLQTQQRIWSLAREAQDWPGVLEAVPGMNNLMLAFARPPRDIAALRDRLVAAWDAARPMTLQGRVIELPVIYDTFRKMLHALRQRRFVEFLREDLREA